MLCILCFFQAEDGIRDLVRSRGLGDVYKRQVYYLDLWWSDKAKNPAPIGHIINDMHFERLEKMITNEHVFYGGKSNPRTKFIQPTILKDIGMDHPTMHEEIFGPILPVMSFDLSLIHISEPTRPY